MNGITNTYKWYLYSDWIRVFKLCYKSFREFPLLTIYRSIDWTESQCALMWREAIKVTLVLMQQTEGSIGHIIQMTWYLQIEKCRRYLLPLSLVNIFNTTSRVYILRRNFPWIFVVLTLYKTSKSDYHIVAIAGLAEKADGRLSPWLAVFTPFWFICLFCGANITICSAHSHCWSPRLLNRRQEMT